MDPIPDFSDRRSFPGTSGNPFDKVLNKIELLETLHPVLFAVLLLVVAALPTALVPLIFGRPVQWFWTVGLWSFSLSDWALLELLPRFGKSYGPTHTPTTLLAIFRAAFALLPVPVALVFEALGTLMVVYGFWIEPHRIRVTYQTLKSDKLAPGKPPLRILHLSDLHVERLTAREEQLTALVRDLKPDLILFTGDILNLSYLDDPTAQQHARQVISQWDASVGVFGVTGSPAVDFPDTFGKVIDGLPICWLRDEVHQVVVDGKKINLVGLTCTHKPFIDGPKLQELTAQIKDGFTILLYHSPDLAPNAARTGKINLQLSGHTHGGQVRLPLLGALYAGSLYGKRFEAGRYQVEGMTLYVSRGIGMEGKGAPRVRFFCPPEVILWELSYLMEQ